MINPLRVIDGIDDFRRASEDWDAMIERQGADVYLTSSWISAWFRQFGRPGTKLIAVCSVGNDGSLEFGLPFTVTTLWAGPVPVTVAKIAASDVNYGYLKLPVPVIGGESCWLALLDRLFSETGADLVAMSPISAACPNLEDLLGAVAGSEDYRDLPHEQERVHTLMRLPESFEAFLASLSKSRRSEYKKDFKRLSKLATIANRTADGEAAIEHFQDFVDLHTNQWHAVNRPGHFGDWPGSIEFYTDLIASLSNTSKARFDEQFADDHLLSSQFCFVQGKTCYWRLTARTLDSQFAKHGAGKVGLMQRVERLISEGVELVEAGAGQYEYKNSFGGEEISLHHVLVTHKGNLAREKARLIVVWSNLFNLLYYRLWILKIAPRLGLRKAPLWQSWIRTRL